MFVEVWAVGQVTSNLEETAAGDFLGEKIFSLINFIYFYFVLLCFSSFFYLEGIVFFILFFLSNIIMSIFEFFLYKELW